MTMVYCRSCATVFHETARACVQCGSARAVSMQFAPEWIDGVPDRVRGWCWGGFLLGPIWAVGNRTWWGLLALVPYVNVGVLVWLGLKGRELAWKNGGWDSVAHFNRVQRMWSLWGIAAASLLALCLALVFSSGTGQPATEMAARQEQANVITADAI